jgi:hypothetical protein
MPPIIDIGAGFDFRSSIECNFVIFDVGAGVLAHVTLQIA